MPTVMQQSEPIELFKKNLKTNLKPGIRSNPLLIFIKKPRNLKHGYSNKAQQRVILIKT